MAEKSKEDRLSLTIVALVALVAIVSLAAIVLNLATPSSVQVSSTNSNMAGAARTFIRPSLTNDDGSFECVGNGGCRVGGEYYDPGTEICKPCSHTYSG